MPTKWDLFVGQWSDALPRRRNIDVWNCQLTCMCRSPDGVRSQRRLVEIRVGLITTPAGLQSITARAWGDWPASRVATGSLPTAWYHVMCPRVTSVICATCDWLNFYLFFLRSAPFRSDSETSTKLPHSCAIYGYRDITRSLNKVSKDNGCRRKTAALRPTDS